MSEVLTEDGVPRALTSDKYPDPERLSDPTLNLYRVQAVADLTGRGVMDIVVEGRDALGTWSTSTAGGEASHTGSRCSASAARGSADEPL